MSYCRGSTTHLTRYAVEFYQGKQNGKGLLLTRENVLLFLASSVGARMKHEPKKSDPYVYIYEDIICTRAPA